MKSVFTLGNPLRSEIRDVPIPTVTASEVLIKVVCCASNPKDWKAPDHIHAGSELNQGQDMAGYIVAVGADVYDFRPGDRVAAAHPMQTPHGAYAEYSTAPAETCFLIPPHVSFEEACTIPFALCTAALGFYQRLQLPFPTSPLSRVVSPPLIVYGAASAVGAYSLKLAKLGNFTKVIAICGQGADYVRSLDIATHVIDYRNNDVVLALHAALAGDKCFHAVDAINNGVSWDTLSAVVEHDGGRISVYLPRLDYSSIPEGIFLGVTYYGTVNGWQTPGASFPHETQEDVDFGFAIFKFMGRWLADGRLSGHPYEVMPRGLESVDEALHLLKDGKVSAKKLIFRIAETPGITATNSIAASLLVYGKGKITNGVETNGGTVDDFSKTLYRV